VISVLSEAVLREVDRSCPAGVKFSFLGSMSALAGNLKPPILQSRRVSARGPFCLLTIFERRMIRRLKPGGFHEPVKFYSS